MPSPPAPWKVYRQALAPLKHGDALWEPGPIYSYRRVKPGDVGYTRRGRFHLLFSAGIPLGSRGLGTDVPLTFEPLDIGPIVSGEVRPPGYLRTNTVREIGADLGGSVTVACPVEPGARVAFALTHKQGAALITQHPTYREDIERERTFENYIKRHYDSWVDFARELGHGENIKPVLVTGVDLTREFATIAYSDNQARMECEFSAGVPAVASASVSVWGSWNTQGLVHTNCGPHPLPARGNRITSGESTPESVIPDEYDQCVFLRYYTIRRRVFIPTVLKAGAGPHQLPEGSPGEDDTGEEMLLVSSEDDSMEIDNPETGSPTYTSDDVTHNVPLDDRDDFDVVAEFIFQRSNAESVLLHHDDIQNLLQGDEEELIRTLDESGVGQRIKIDENGVAQLVNTTVIESPERVQPGPNIEGASNGEERIGDSEAADASRDDRAAGEPEQRRSSPYSNAGKLEGIRPPDLHPNWKSSGPYPLSSTQGSPAGPSGYSTTFTNNNTNIISRLTAHSGYSGAVEEGHGLPVGSSEPEFQLPSQGDLRAVVPQLQYPRGDSQKGWAPQSPIHFYTQDHPGVKLFDVLDEQFEGMDNAGDPLFILDSRGITIRIHFSGYASSTEVERTLKEKAETGGRTKGMSMQLSTGNRGLAANSITRSKLAQEVAKCIKGHITDLEANRDLFPFDELAGEQWRLGQGKMTVDHMVIIDLVNVSSGSWSPIICIE